MMVVMLPADWRSDPDRVRPVVLVLGGFLTSPFLYRRLERRLRERGAADVLVAPVWTPDWLLVPVRDYRAIVGRSAQALLDAGERSAGSAESRGAPILVVGHSAGGISARLLTSPVPFHGRRLGGSGRIGAIVTLGTPHHVAPGHRLAVPLRRAAIAFAEAVVPGATFAPTTGYVSVAGRSTVGRPDAPDARSRQAYRMYAGLLGPGADRAAIDGDGLVPVECARLPGATDLVLEGIGHGQLAGRPWYGSPEAVERWWPVALAAWHAALRARAGGDAAFDETSAAS